MSEVIPFEKKPLTAAVQALSPDPLPPFLDGPRAFGIDDWVVVDEETCPYPALCGSVGKVALVLDGFVSIINEQDGLWLSMLPARWLKHA